MTEDQIERRVEKMTDRLDARYMADGSAMTEAEYKAELKDIDDWAQTEYVKLFVTVEKARAAKAR